MINVDKRTCIRTDLTSKLIHLTRGRDNKDGFEVLCDILEANTLHKNNLRNWNAGGIECVCFQDAPLLSVVQELYSLSLSGGDEADRKYSWYGIRVDKKTVYQDGGRPVIYNNKNYEAYQIKEPWRFVRHELRENYNPVDVTYEREWRVPTDFHFLYSQISVLVKNTDDYHRFVEWCLKGHQNILQEIQGIIILEDLLN